MNINYAQGEPRARLLAAYVECYMHDRGVSSVTMTAATEAIWGTSGRGNPNAVRLIEACAALGYLHIEQRGTRNRRVSRTPRVIEDGAYAYGGLERPGDA